MHVPAISLHKGSQSNQSENCFNRKSISRFFYAFLVLRDFLCVWQKLCERGWSLRKKPKRRLGKRWGNWVAQQSVASSSHLIETTKERRWVHVQMQGLPCVKICPTCLSVPQYPDRLVFVVEVLDLHPLKKIQCDAYISYYSWNAFKCHHHWPEWTWK